MRSEKEIREKSEFVSRMRGKEIDEIVSFLDWTLEGKPRYSVKELEKLAILIPCDEDDEFYGSEREMFEYSLEDLKKVLKKKKKVKEILERD